MPQHKIIVQESNVTPSEQPSEAQPPREETDRVLRPVCVANKRNGKPCNRKAVPGCDVCVMHGGGAPFMRQVAQKRLLSLVEPALALVLTALNSDCEYSIIGTEVICEIHGAKCPDWKEKLTAARIVLDRAGFGPSAKLTLERPTTNLSDLDKERLADELQQLSEQVRAYQEPPTRDALPPAQYNALDAEILRDEAFFDR